MSSDSFSSKRRLNFPSKSVTVPLFESFTITFAPKSGKLFSSITSPEIVF